MKYKENDPDTLQILDELNEKWVTRWKKATRKKTSQTNRLKVIVQPMEKINSPNLQKNEGL